MINYILLIPILVSFFITLFFLPVWIRKAKQIGLVWEDMNKLQSEKVSGSGGVMALGGFTIGILLFVAYRVFYLESYNSHLIEIFALLCSVLMLGGIGFMDDLFGWQHGGLSKRTRIILVLFAAIPLVVINAGKSSISLPFVGSLELGLIYVLVFIPIGILGATVTFNFLAGYNGLEAGLGAILLFSLSVVALFTGNSWISVVGLCMVFSLLAFLIFNYSPAKVFPGDVITYPIGGMIAIAAILGNFEKIAIFFFIPFILEVGLKLRGKLVKQSFGMPGKDGSLRLRYNEIYSLNHLAIYLMQKYKIKPTEKKVVWAIWAFQIVIVLIGFFIFRKGIFL